MKAVRHEPIRKGEFTKDQWFEIACAQDPGLTRLEFNVRWPAFCKYLEEIQNAEIIEWRHEAH